MERAQSSTDPIDARALSAVAKHPPHAFAFPLGLCVPKFAVAILGLLAVHIPCNRVCALNKESCDDQMIMVLQALTPQMTENKKRVEELLREALVLQAALESETEAGL